MSVYLLTGILLEETKIKKIPSPLKRRSWRIKRIPSRIKRTPSKTKRVRLRI